MDYSNQLSAIQQTLQGIYATQLFIIGSVAALIVLLVLYSILKKFIFC